MAEAVMQPAEGKTKALGGQSILLKRELGWASIFVFALASIGLTYAGLFPFSIVAGMYPGSNLIGVVTIGAVLALILAYGYAIIGSIVPHYGADYLLSSRVIHPALAFCSSVVVVAFLSIAGGTLVTSLAQDTLPMFAQILTTVTAILPL
jgi:amino acid transporter